MLASLLQTNISVGLLRVSHRLEISTTMGPEVETWGEQGEKRRGRSPWRVPSSLPVQIPPLLPVIQTTTGRLDTRLDQCVYQD